MRNYVRRLLILPGVALATSGTIAERIAINDNRAPAGTLRSGVLTVRLEARVGEWRPDRESDPALVVQAFAEEGKPLQIPGPLIRVPRGTVIHASIRNSLDSSLVVHGLSPRGAEGPGADTVRVRPGETREVRFVAGVPGTYYYWGTTTGAVNMNRPGLDSQLSGAFIVDDGTNARQSASERVLVIGLWTQLPSGGFVAQDAIVRFVLNGRTWPNTERLTYTVGDTVRFRILNTTPAVHPMHLHGFYFNVESRGDGRVDQVFDPAGSRHFAVTERAAPGRTFTLAWVPERAGNWMFHCHDNVHVLRNRPLDGTPLPAEHMQHVENHALEMMGGLVMGIDVRARAGAASAPAEPRERRRLRLAARVDSGGTDVEPAYGYVLHEGAKVTPASAPLLPGPTIVLKRGEPVGITVVNELREATAVHWHGIELDSYYDGVAGFSGQGRRISPVIAPRDSFEARFTPPRAGTFIYHPHADEVRQQQAGLSGAIVVLEPGTTYDPVKDIVLLISTPRLEADGEGVLLNGSATPAAREWRVGERYRLRIVNIHTYRPSMIALLQRDTAALRWRAVAKDGMDLPTDQATERPARQQLGNGEAYDFEFTPVAPGDYRFAVMSGAGALLVTMPIRVR